MKNSLKWSAPSRQLSSLYSPLYPYGIRTKRPSRRCTPLYFITCANIEMNQCDWDIPSCRIVSINKSSSLVFDNLEGIRSFDLKPDEVLTISIAFGGSKIDQLTEKSGAFLARRSVWVNVGANIGLAIL